MDKHNQRVYPPSIDREKTPALMYLICCTISALCVCVCVCVCVSVPTVHVSPCTHVLVRQEEIENSALWKRLKLHFWEAIKAAVLFTTWCVLCVCVMCVVLWGGHQRDKRMKTGGGGVVVLQQLRWQVRAPDRVTASLLPHTSSLRLSSAAALLPRAYAFLFLHVILFRCGYRFPYIPALFSIK